jgi:hypothetical protein
VAVDETLLRERPTARPLSPSQLLRDLGKPGPATHSPEPGPAPPSSAEDDPDTLPLPGAPYVAHSRIGNKPEVMLTLVLKDWSVPTFAYGDLRFMDFQPGTEAGKRPVLVLRFTGVAEVRLEGRHLRRLVDPLRRQRLAWLAEQGRDSRDDDAVAITGVTIKMLE